MKSSTDWVSCPECNGTGEQEYEQNVPMGYHTDTSIHTWMTALTAQVWERLRLTTLTMSYNYCIHAA